MGSLHTAIDLVDTIRMSECSMKILSEGWAYVVVVDEGAYEDIFDLTEALDASMALAIDEGQALVNDEGYVELSAGAPFRISFGETALEASLYASLPSILGFQELEQTNELTTQTASRHAEGSFWAESFGIIAPLGLTVLQHAASGYAGDGKSVHLATKMQWDFYLPYLSIEQSNALRSFYERALKGFSVRYYDSATSQQSLILAKEYTKGAGHHIRRMSHDADFYEAKLGFRKVES